VFTLEVLESRLLLAAQPAVSWGSSTAALVRDSGGQPAWSLLSGPATPMPMSAAALSPAPPTMLAPPTDDVYVIVPESHAPHDTPATAQPIPSVAYAGVLGTLSLGDTIDLYRVIAGPGTLSLRLAPTSNADGTAPAFQLSVFDAVGRLIATAGSNGGVANLSIDAQSLGIALGSALNIGISPKPGTWVDQPTGYQLWFLRENAEPAAGAEAPGSSPMTAPITPVIGGFTAVTAVLFGKPAPVASAAGAFTAVPAIAQLPTLTASALGGVLADGPAVTTVDTHTVADGETVETGETVPYEPDEIEHASGSNERSPVVALRASGALPLLTAPVRGDWQGERDPARDRNPEAGPETHTCATVPQATAGSLMMAVAACHAPCEETSDQLIPSAVVETELNATAPRLGDAGRVLAPGLAPAAALTAYMLIVDRTAIHELFDARQAEGVATDGERRWSRNLAARAWGMLRRRLRVR
jgi:hypothetical protein